MIIRQITVKLENTTGSVARITALLASHGINIIGFVATSDNKNGILRMIAAKHQLAKDILTNHNYSVTLEEVVCLKLKDVAGALNNALLMLSQNGINLKYLYTISSRNGESIVVMDAPNVKALINILLENGFKLLCFDEIA